MAKKKTTKVAQPKENPPPKCPQGQVWSQSLQKCVDDVG